MGWCRGVDFSVSKGVEEVEEKEEEEEETKMEEAVEEVVDALLLKTPKSNSGGEATETPAVPKPAGEGKEEAKGGAGSSSLIPQEMRAVGKVKGSIYLAYLRSWGPGYIMPIATLVAFLLFQVPNVKHVMSYYIMTCSGMSIPTLNTNAAMWNGTMDLYLSIASKLHLPVSIRHHTSA